MKEMKFKSYETLDFTDDFLFSKILSTDLDLTKELLEIILNKEIREVRLAEAEKAMKLTPLARGVRLDVYVKDEDNVVYDVEMQTTSPKDLGKRARYYQGIIDLNMIEAGMRFSDLDRSFVIFILKHAPKGIPKNLPVYTFRSRCDEDPEVVLNDDAVKVFVNAEGPLDGLSDGLKHFLQFIRDENPRDEFTEKLDGRVKRAREFKDWREEYMTLGMKYQEYFESGKEAGFESGYESGQKAGKETGMLEAQKIIIYSALDNAMTPSEIEEKLKIPKAVIDEVLEARKKQKA